MRKQLFLVFVFFILVGKTYSQEFITRWEFLASPTDTLRFTIGSTGPVNYTWETVPAGISGSGVITGTNAVIIGMFAGKSIRLKLDPEHLTQFQMYGPGNR